MAGFKNNSPQIGLSGRTLNSKSTGVSRYFLNGGNTTNPEAEGTGLSWSANNSSHTHLHTVPDYCMDEIYLYASNPNSSNATLNIFLSKLYKDYDYPQISVTIEAGKGTALVLPGLLFYPGSHLYVKTSTSDYLRFHGNVIRRYQIDGDDVGIGYAGDEK